MMNESFILQYKNFHWSFILLLGFLHHVFLVFLPLKSSM